MIETVQILRFHFSDNKTLQHENNFKKHISKIDNAVRVRRMRHLTLEGKINVFKSLSISKIIHFPLVTPMSTDIINLLNTVQKSFLWKIKYPKIKHKTLCKNQEQDDLKSVNIFSKIASLQCSSIQKLYDKTFHKWKIIPLHLFDRYLRKNFIFILNSSKIIFNSKFPFLLSKNIFQLVKKSFLSCFFNFKNDVLVSMV